MHAPKLTPTRQARVQIRRRGVKISQRTNRPGASVADLTGNRATHRLRRHGRPRLPLRPHRLPALPTDIRHRSRRPLHHAPVRHQAARRHHRRHAAPVGVHSDTPTSEREQVRPRPTWWMPAPDEHQASGSARSAPASLLHPRKGGTAVVAFEFHATGHCGFRGARSAALLLSPSERARRGPRNRRPLRTTTKRLAPEDAALSLRLAEASANRSLADTLGARPERA
jgi:hypothetical protein